MGYGVVLVAKPEVETQIWAHSPAIVDKEIKLGKPQADPGMGTDRGDRLKNGRWQANRRQLVTRQQQRLGIRDKAKRDVRPGHREVAGKQQVVAIYKLRAIVAVHQAVELDPANISTKLYQVLAPSPCDRVRILERVVHPRLRESERVDTNRTERLDQKLAERPGC